MKTICIITPSLSGGGAEKIAVNLANHWAKSGFFVHLVTLRDVLDYSHLVSTEITVLNVSARRVRYSIYALRRYLSATRPNVVLSVIRDSNIITALACVGMRYKPRIVFREANTFHGILSKTFVWRVLYHCLMKSVYNKAFSVIANSGDTLEDLKRHGILKGNKGCIIPNPVLPENYNELTKHIINHPWFKDQSKKIILSVGRLHLQKDHASLIRAFAKVYRQLPESRLVILGKGEEEVSLKRLCSELNLDSVVYFGGFKKNPFPYYKMADVFVLTSRWEGFGNVIVEALSTGTPVVSTKSPGGPAFILNDGEYGYLVSVGDHKAIAEAILKAIESNVDSKKLIQRAEEFTVRTIGERYLHAMGIVSYSKIQQ